MKEISEMMLLFSLICLAVGNTTPVHCEPKKDETENNEKGEQMKKGIINVQDGNNVEAALREVEEYRVTFSGYENAESECDGDLLMYREYFGTKDKTRDTLLLVAKCFVLFYMSIGYLLGMDQEVPEILFIVGLLSLAVKFLI